MYLQDKCIFYFKEFDSWSSILRSVCLFSVWNPEKAAQDTSTGLKPALMGNVDSALPFNQVLYADLTDTPTPPRWAVPLSTLWFTGCCLWFPQLTNLTSLLIIFALGSNLFATQKTTFGSCKELIDTIVISHYLLPVISHHASSDSVFRDYFASVVMLRLQYRTTIEKKNIFE